MPDPRVSVLLPVRNGMPRLLELLSALAGQRVEGGFELVAADTSSTDGSFEALESAGARTRRIDRREFDHGETRNTLVGDARGEHVVFLSQDAVPQGPSFLEALVRPLADPRVAGVFARQVPRAGADPCTRRDLGTWVAASDVPRLVLLPDGQLFDHLPPAERHRMAVFDNVASAVRRQVLLAHPFAASRFGEDLEWGLRMVRLGHGIAYTPEAVVEHSHERTARSLYRRNYLGHRLLFRLFGLASIPDRSHLARAGAGALWSDLRTLLAGRARLTQVLGWPLRAVCATYGQYRGARDEREGRPYPSWA